MIWDLFWTFVKIGCFSFGGGYASLPLIEQMIVQEKGWLSMQQMQDMIAISQMTPGPIGINAATFTGMQTFGISGALAASLGFVCPSLIIVGILVLVYYRFSHVGFLKKILEVLRPVVIGLIAASGASIMLQTFVAASPDLAGVLAGIRVDLVMIFLLSVFLLTKKKMNSIVVMLIAGLIEVLWQWIIL